MDMKRRTIFAIAVAAVAGFAPLAHAETVIRTGETSLGTVLTDARGMTLYIFDKDVPGVSNCNGACAEKWPPLKASGAARPQGDFGIIIRADGSRQWAKAGMPLYLWVKDAAPGDVTGDGVKNVWHVARP